MGVSWGRLRVARAARLASGDELPQAALFASAFASLCVERSGAANSMPSYAEALARMQAHPECVPEPLEVMA